MRSVRGILAILAFAIYFLCSVNPAGAQSSWRVMGGVWTLISDHPVARPRAIIICVAGLGLPAESYRQFATILNDEGYLVCSMSLHGFGPPAIRQGKKFSAKRSALNLLAMTSELQHEYPTVPVVFVGESVGGATVLRAQSIHPCATGIICSSVSVRVARAPRLLAIAQEFLLAGRFKKAVTRKFAHLGTPNPSVAEKIIADDDYRLQLKWWEACAAVREGNRAVKYAAAVKNTPVLVLHGLEDRLAAYSGTFKLYKNLATRDKTILIVPEEGHLLLEEHTPSDNVLRYLSTWLESRLNNGNATASLEAGDNT